MPKDTFIRKGPIAGGYVYEVTLVRLQKEAREPRPDELKYYLRKGFSHEFDIHVTETRRYIDRPQIDEEVLEEPRKRWRCKICGEEGFLEAGMCPVHGLQSLEQIEALETVENNQDAAIAIIERTQDYSGTYVDSQGYKNYIKKLDRIYNRATTSDKIRDALDAIKHLAGQREIIDDEFVEEVREVLKPFL